MRPFKRLIPGKARLLYICSRLFYQFIPARARSRIISKFGRAWQFFCPVCENRVSGFASLPDFYFQQLEEHGSDLQLTDFETCNFRAYQCPHCGATDRDRLYAIYLAARLPSTEAQQANFCLLDIPPPATNSRQSTCNCRRGYCSADLLHENEDVLLDITSKNC